MIIIADQIFLYCKIHVLLLLLLLFLMLNSSFVMNTLKFFSEATTECQCNLKYIKLNYRLHELSTSLPLEVSSCINSNRICCANWSCEYVNSDHC